MNAEMKRISALPLLVVFFIAFFFVKFVVAQQVVPEDQDKINQVEKNAEKIVPSPKDIRESTGIYVFMTWMWVAIFVIIYFLKLKIKEVDRLYKLKFFSGKRK